MKLKLTKEKKMEKAWKFFDTASLTPPDGVDPKSISRPHFRQISVESPPPGSPLTDEEIRQIAEGVSLKGRSYNKVEISYIQ